MTLPSRRAERGVAIIWFALFLMFFLAVIALGVDMAKLAATRTQLQNAADAAALAAASAVDPTTGAITHDVAIARAQETSAQDKAFITGPQPVVVAAGDVAFLSGNRVQVTTRRTGDSQLVTQFAMALGLPRLDVTATAIAKADTASSPDCIAPVGVVLDAGKTLQTGCNNIYTLKTQPGLGQQGNYGYLALVSCPESDPPNKPPQNPHHIAWLIEHGWCCGMKIGDMIDTAPGTKVPADEPFSNLILADTDQRLGICYSDYHGNGKRLLTVPIFGGPSGGWPNGASEPIKVTGFGTFFLRDNPEDNHGDIHGEFVYVPTVGSGGGTAASGGVTYVLRLVR